MFFTPLKDIDTQDCEKYSVDVYARKCCGIPVSRSILKENAFSAHQNIK